MSRCLFAKKNVHLDFCHVGRIVVKDSKIQMKFFRKFIRELDVNDDLESVFRPQTAQSDMSIMTDPSPCQSYFSSVDYTLPKYVCFCLPFLLHCHMGLCKALAAILHNFDLRLAVPKSGD
jgi:hypothetical protein